MKKLFKIYFSLWLCIVNTCNANNITNIYNNNNYEAQKETKFEKCLRIVGAIVGIAGGIIAIRNAFRPAQQQIIINNVQPRPQLQIGNELVF